MSQELISRMLELCEQHMNEGDYLESAKLLKEVHKNHKNPLNHIHLQRPIAIYSIDDERAMSNADYKELFRVIAFDWDGESSNMEITLIEDADDPDEEESKTYKLDLYAGFMNYLELKLEMNSVFGVEIRNSIFPTKIITGEPIINSIKFMERVISGRDIDSEPEYIMGQLHRVFSENIIAIIKHTCKFAKRGNLEFC